MTIVTKNWRFRARSGRPPVVPPVLYIPVREHPGRETIPEVRPLTDGRTALLAYTALDRLASRCGENQAWVLLHLSELADIKADYPFDVVAFDPRLPDELTTNGRVT